MNNFLKKAVAKILREVADKIDSGNCELSEDQAMDIISALSHEVLSKDEACGYLNLSRSRFDDLVREGSINSVREKGLLRMEGKDYIMQDGDIVLFRFNV